MKRTRKKSYVEREMRRRRIAEYWRIVNKVEECVKGVALVVVTEAFLLSLCLL